MKRLLWLFIFFFPMAVFAQQEDEQDQEDIEQIEILNFGKKYKARMDSLERVTEELRYDSLYYLLEPEYVVIAPTALMDTLKLSNIDTLKFFFPPKVLLVDVNHYNDSISVYQASTDTMELRMNPKFMLVPEGYEVEPDEKPKYWTHGGYLRVHMAQVSLTNWNPGGKAL
ncbi:hypothetical protein [Persicobacter sp. CCB-QB2]|uniref:hypothetical protein n=1 Tax=Persicobacter sp. CCB-QB2 TaxID=1561025 RepID=UPI0006A9F21F|nr:hypothetical protein [Persicobacter sp. CCB-QB2]